MSASNTKNAPAFYTRLPLSLRQKKILSFTNCSKPAMTLRHIADLCSERDAEHPLELLYRPTNALFRPCIIWVFTFNSYNCSGYPLYAYTGPRRWVPHHYCICGLSSITRIVYAAALSPVRDLNIKLLLYWESSHVQSSDRSRKKKLSQHVRLLLHIDSAVHPACWVERGSRRLLVARWFHHKIALHRM